MPKLGFSTEQLQKQFLDQIEKNNYFFHSDIWQGYPMSSRTYYDHFPKDSPQWQVIDQALMANRQKTKVGIRAKWYRSEGATQSLALYKLIGTDEERKKLSQQYTDVTSQGKSVFQAPVLNFEVVNPDPETLKVLKGEANEIENESRE